MKLPSELLHEMRSWTPEDRERVRRELLARFPPWPDGSREWPERMPCSARPYVLFIGVSSGNSPPVSGLPHVHEAPRSSRGHLTFGSIHENFGCADTKGFFAKLRDLAQALVAQAEPSFALRFSERDYLSVSGLLNLGLGFDGTANEGSTQPRVIEWVANVTEQLAPAIVIGCGLRSVFSRGPNLQAWAEGGSRLSWACPWTHELPIAGAYRLRWKPVTYSSGAVGHVYLLPNHPSRPPLTSPSGWSDTKRAILQHQLSLVRNA
jgi:hypothetical protein